eukprot:GGOE01058718.1.p2 GENE.GGOE01058718.1~~GGOE01058718.1.p2  ORF type:complete len:202 (-),score=40.12 GGOE01058718.1:228-833(-)
MNNLLINACSKGDEQLVAVLLESRADIHHRGKGGRTPLHTVLGRVKFSSDPSVIRLLLEAKADLHVPDDNGNTPLHEACRYDKPPPPALLLEEHLDAINRFGNSPLHVAAVNASFECLQLLARLAADPFVRNARGQLPLDLTNRADVTTLIHGAIKGRIRTFLLVLLRKSDPIYAIDPYLIRETLGPNGFLFRHVAPGTLW